MNNDKYLLFKDLLIKNVKKELNVATISNDEINIIFQLFNKMPKDLSVKNKITQTAQQFTKLKTVDDVNIQDYLQESINTLVETENDQYVSSVIDDNKTKPTKINLSQTTIDSFLGIKDLYTLQMLFNPESLYTHHYIVLDSNYRITAQESATTTVFKWNYARTKNITTGFCNSASDIRDIIGMRMYQPRVPYVVAMDTSAKRVSVLIAEFSAQAFIGENGRRFHFLFRPNYSTATTSVELSTEDYNDGIFNFRKPISSFDTLSISFGDPLVLVSFTTSSFDRFIIPIEFICYKSDK